MRLNYFIYIVFFFIFLFFNLDQANTYKKENKEFYSLIKQRKELVAYYNWLKIQKYKKNSDNQDKDMYSLEDVQRFYITIDD